MNRHLLLAVAMVPLASALPPPAVAASATPVTVGELVARHLEARGGVEAMRAIHTLVCGDGRYREADYVGSGNAFMAFQRPYFRVVGNPERPGAVLEGYDGAAWEWYADPGVVVRTVGAAAGATRRGTRFMGPFLDFREQGNRIELGEPEVIDGRLTHRLVVTAPDGFVRQYFLDQESHLVVAERRSAPFHAFGDPVTSETRVGDYREVAGVRFPFRFRETEIATGEMMSEMQWGTIEAGVELPARWFSPPEYERTQLQHFLELLYAERSDEAAVVWSYDDFRRAHPEVDTGAGVEMIGYQMLKMGDSAAAVALLERNREDHPEAASAAFAVGRAYATAGRPDLARGALRRALELDPEHRRAAEALAGLE